MPRTDLSMRFVAGAADRVSRVTLTNREGHTVSIETNDLAAYQLFFAAGYEVCPSSLQAVC